jgi:uroporphyrinogen-III synthase
MDVINTRPSLDADSFSWAIRAAGAKVILSPVLDIRFRDGAATVEPGESLAFTSANGVRAFARVNADRDLRVFAVGAATAEEARRAGFCDVSAADGDVASLAGLIAKAKGPSKILHLAGSDRAGDLVAALAESGVSARRLVLYEATPIPCLSDAARNALADKPQNCAVGLFSPRSAALFLMQCANSSVEKQLSRAKLFAFSDAVAAAATPGRWGGVKIATERTLDAMAALIRA